MTIERAVYWPGIGLANFTDSSLAALAFLERDNKEVIQQTLAGDPHNGWALMPVGRSSWHSSYASRLISELQAEPMKAALMRAGFAKNDAEFVDLFIENFKRIARRVGW